MGNSRVKASRLMVSLAAVTTVLGSYGLFRLLHHHGGMPKELAVAGVAGADLFCAAVAKHALRVAEDGDSAGPWNVVIVIFAAATAGLQYTGAHLDGHPPAVGVLMGMFPLATVLLWEGTLRRAYRVNGRRTGQVAQPRARINPLVMFVRWHAYWHGVKLTVLDPSLTAQDAVRLGIVFSDQSRQEQGALPVGTPGLVQVQPGNIVPGTVPSTENSPVPGLDERQNDLLTWVQAGNRPTVRAVKSRYSVGTGTAQDMIAAVHRAQRGTEEPQGGRGFYF